CFSREARSQHLDAVSAGRRFAKNRQPFGGRGLHRRGRGFPRLEQLHLRARDDRVLRIDNFDFDLGGNEGQKGRQQQKCSSESTRKPHGTSPLSRERLVWTVHAGLLALRVRMRALAPASGYYNRPSQAVIFQTFPVTGCVVLAYSCAAARDLHPLPIGCVSRPTIMREPNIEKEQKQQLRKFTGPRDTKSNACARAAPVFSQAWARALPLSPLVTGP